MPRRETGLYIELWRQGDRLKLLDFQSAATIRYQYVPKLNIHGGLMAKNTSITLGDHFESFISEQLESGRYGSASEVVRAGLRLLEDSEHKLQALRQMLIQGEESGIAEYNYNDFLNELDEPQR